MAPIQKTLDANTTVEKVFKPLTDPERLPKHRRSSEEGTRLCLTCPRSLVTFILIALLLSGLALLLRPGPRALAATQGGEGGHVYVLNNDLSGTNSVTIFDRQEDGSLTLHGTASIGGLGSLSAFGSVNPGSQGSLILKDDKTKLFAVDAGSNQISVVT